MKKRLVQKIVALAMAFTLIAGEGSVAMAAQTDTGIAVSDEMGEAAEESEEKDVLVQQEESAESTETAEEQASEEVEEAKEESTEETGTEADSQENQEKAEEAVTETEEAATEAEEAVTETEEAATEAEEAVTETEETAEETEEITEEATTEEGVSEEDPDALEKEEDKAKNLFPGLGTGYVLSAEQKEDKKVLSAYVDEISSMTESVNYVSGQIMVGAETEEQAEEYAKAFGGTLIDYVMGAAVISLGEAEDGSGIPSVAMAIAASAREDILLPAAWPNYYRYIYAYEDPFLNEASAYAENPNASTDEEKYLFSSYQWHHNAIGSRQAWESEYTGAGVKVAVLDTGILSTHEDIKIDSSNVKYSGSTEITITSGEDGAGHGTHVAGIIAAQSNDKGGVGVAPGVTLYSYKVMNDDGAGDSASILAGLEAAINDGVNIINMSLGGAGYSEVEEAAYLEAYEKGIAIFAAAGNDGAQSASYPASYVYESGDKKGKGVIAVAAVDTNNHKADFSNYGSWVRYSAPGVNIVSTYIGGTNFYKAESGTSMATPVVAGIAALLWKEATEGKEGAAKVDSLLALMDKNCTKVTGTGMGKGVVSLIKALGLDGVTTAPVKPVFSVKSGTSFVTDKEEVQKVTISAGKGSTIYYSTDGKNITYKNGTLSANAKKYTSGEEIELNPLCNAKGKVTLKAIAINNNNQLASAVVTTTYTLQPKYASSLEITSATGNNQVALGKSLKLTAALNPVYVTDKTVKWEVEGDTTGKITVKNGTVTVKKDAQPGKYTVKATANGTNTVPAATNTFSIEVLNTENPITAIVLSPKTITVAVDKEEKAEVTVTKKKKDTGVATDISWSSADSSIATVSATADGLTIQGKKAGKTKITGVANDGFGKKVSFNVTVTQPVTKIDITSSTGNDKVAAGKSVNLIATITPADATIKKLTWSSDNDLVKVSNAGKVTVKPQATGTAKIKATATDGSDVTGEYTLNILSGRITSLSLDQKAVSIFRKTNSFGAAAEATVKVTVGETDTGNWTATSSNTNLVTVTKSDSSVTVKATGNATGTATITVMTTDGSNIKKTFKVTVSNPATALHLAPEKGRSSTYLAYKKTLKLTATLETSFGAVDSKAKKIKWESLNDYATVKNGVVTAKDYTINTDRSAKYAVIKASTTDGSNLEAYYVVALVGQMWTVKLLKYAKDNTGQYIWNSIDEEYVTEPHQSTYTIKVGETNAVDLGGTYNINLHNLHGAISPRFSFDCDYKVNKEGLSITKISGTYYIVGNKAGTYKLTISANDGSPGKATYTIQVK